MYKSFYQPIASIDQGHSSCSTPSQEEQCLVLIKDVLLLINNVTNWKLGNKGNKNNDLNFGHQMLMKIYKRKKNEIKFSN
jgi:hypothetical protein